MHHLPASPSHQIATTLGRAHQGMGRQYLRQWSRQKLSICKLPARHSPLFPLHGHWHTGLLREARRYRTDHNWFAHLNVCTARFVQALKSYCKYWHNVLQPLTGRYMPPPALWGEHAYVTDLLMAYLGPGTHHPAMHHGCSKTQTCCPSPSYALGLLFSPTQQPGRATPK
jgi:hypothetical protein